MTPTPETLIAEQIASGAWSETWVRNNRDHVASILAQAIAQTEAQDAHRVKVRDDARRVARNNQTKRAAA